MPSPLPHRKSDLMHWNTCESPPPSDSQGASDVSEFDKVGEYYNNDGMDYDSPSSDTHTNTNSPNNTGQRNARWDSTQPVSSPAAAIPGLRRRKNATKRNAINADDYNNNNNDDRHTTEQKYDDVAHSPTPHTFQPPIFPFVHVNEVEMEADDGYRTPPSTSSPKRRPPPPLSSDGDDGESNQSDYESDAKSFYDDNNNSDNNDSINNMDDDQFHRKNSRMTMKNSKEGTESTANLNSSRTSISEELNYIDEYNNDNNELNKMMLIEEGSSNGTSNSKGDVGVGGSAARLDRRVRRDNGDDDAGDTYYDDYNDEEEGYYKKKKNSDSNSNSISNFSSDYDYGSDDKIAQQIDNDYNTDDTESRVTTAAKSLISKIQYSRRIIGQMVNNQWVQLIIVLFIVINGIMMGVATSSWVTEDDTIKQVFEYFDQAFLIVFTIEIAMQLCYYSLALFHDGWLIFDLVIVIISWAFDGLQVARAFRIFRAFRLLTRVKPLRDLVLAIGQVLPRMYAISALMVIIFYVFSVLFTELFSDLELSEQYFNTLWDSFFTCMQMMTLEWGDVTREVMETSGYKWASIPFVFYIMIAGFIVFNLIVAVVVEAVAATEETIREMDGIETDTPQDKLDEAQERIDLMQSHVEKMMSEQEQIQTMLETMAGELLNLETERMKSEQREIKLRDEINRRIDYESKQNKIDYQRRMESNQNKMPVHGVKRSTSSDSLGSALSNQSGRKNSSGSRMNVFTKVPDGGNFALRRVDRRILERKARVDEMYQSLSQHGSSSSLHNYRGEDSAESTPRTRRKKKVQLGVDIDDALGIRSKSMHHVESRHDKVGKQGHVKRHSSERHSSEKKSVNWLVSNRGPSSLGKDSSGKSLGVKSCPEFQQQVPHSAPTARKKLDINKIHDGAVSHSPKPGRARAKANWKNMLAMQQL